MKLIFRGFIIFTIRASKMCTLCSGYGYQRGETIVCYKCKGNGYIWEEGLEFKKI